MLFLFVLCLFLSIDILSTKGDGTVGEGFIVIAMQYLCYWEVISMLLGGNSIDIADARFFYYLFSVVISTEFRNVPCNMSVRSWCTIICSQNVKNVA